MSEPRCGECKQPIGARGSRLCADCGAPFHYPDARINEVGRACGVHVIGLRNLLGRDIVPLCLRCDMALRLRHGIPS